MHKSIRQSMAWLHSWAGLLLGWLIFTIFLFGTLSYYRSQISQWMQPQWHQASISQQHAFASAWSYLQKNAPDAQNWQINVASTEQPFNRIYWQAADHRYVFKNIDYRSGQEVSLTTQGGDFFYNFHFQLYAVPVMWGRIITSFAAFFMLIALISGIITHKKIFTDFFTLRTFKSQRSWLDFHNVVSVIALPFFLTITFTGLAIFFYIYLPYGLKHNYSENTQQFFQEIAETPTQHPDSSNPSAAMLTFPQIQSILNKQWAGQPEISTVNVKQPNTRAAQIIIKQKQDHSITLNSPQLVLSGVTGKIIQNTRRNTAVSSLYAGIYGLHMAPFAQPILRFALFLSGLFGCLMIASGMLLWSLKRQLQNKQQQFHFGHYMVDRLNINTCVGLPIAVLAYFYSNRLWTLSHQINLEIPCFFIAWFLSLICALFTPKKILWQSQLAVFIVLAVCLPLLNIFTLFQQHWIHHWQDYLYYLNFDLFVWGFAALAVFIYFKIKPIQEHAKQRMIKKIQQQREIP
ncbi:PepSY-associated TM helix domain-containing protein [Acinetobacter sp.]|uniref:PepSY-associated TM helix domain-containing protein n=1 Tax=Acinetobacter sp. TaxID=472 RepID=UPI0031E36CA4